MKRLKELVVLFLVISTFLVSCDKNDEPAQAAIEGKWQFSKEGEIINGQEILETYFHTAGCTKDFIEFKSGSVFIDTYFEKPVNDCIEYSETGSWTRIGNQLTIFTDDFSQVVTILELTNTTLKIKVEDEDDIYLYVLTRI
jgi:hypothetical protein